MSLEDAETIEPADLRGWGQWLQKHHRRSRGIWLVMPKKASPKWSDEWKQVVPEALRFGWIDSLGRALDAHRTMLYFAPRKPGSNWSALNKRYVAELEAEGRMHASGAAVVAAAQADGSWNALDEVDQLIVPDDLARALDAHGSARAHWDAFPPSARRGILEWILNAKRPATRAKRIEETARLAARGQRANQWPRK